MHKRAALLAFALGLLVVVWPCVGRAGVGPEARGASDGVEFSKYVPGAARLEGRLLAPCCWTQTLDIHGSEIANELRREIRQRLERGESADAIENDLVLRYGERLRATPAHSPIQGFAVALAVGFVLAGGLAVRFLRRLRKRPAPPAELEPRTAESDALDQRIDDELERM